MKKRFLFEMGMIAMLYSSQSYAQCGIFLDCGIIQEAGRQAATGDISSFGIEQPFNAPIYVPAPSAREVAEAMLQAQAEAKQHQESQRLRNLQVKIRGEIDRAYEAEFGK